MHRLIDLFVGTQSRVTRFEYLKYLSRLLGLFVVVLLVLAPIQSVVPQLGFLVWLAALLMLLGIFIVTVKRLHDLSGVPGAWVSRIIPLWLLFRLFFAKGTKRDQIDDRYEIVSYIKKELKTGYTPEQVRAMLVHAWDMNPEQARETVERYL